MDLWKNRKFLICPKRKFLFCSYTKNRTPWINKTVQSRLYDYLGGIIRKHNGTCLAIGGMPDHVHLLIELSSIDKFSYLIRDLKASSSSWIHKTFSDLSEFSWQEGYGSFSVSYSTLDAVRNYIQNQEEKHKTISFDQEYIKFLTIHNVKYDKRFVLG